MKKKIRGRHFYKAQLLHTTWNPETNSINTSYVSAEKDFNDLQLKQQILDYRLTAAGFACVGALCGLVTLAFLVWYFALIACFISGLLGLLGFMVVHYITFDQDKLFDLGEQEGYYSNDVAIIFAEELLKESENTEKQKELAAKWRKEHPFEENCRLAMRGDSNALANIIRYYIKATKPAPQKPQAPQAAPKDKLSVTFLNKKSGKKQHEKRKN